MKSFNDLKENLQLDLPRGGFDNSQTVKFTSKNGELLPILTLDVVPGGEYRIRVDADSRLQPASSPAMIRMREYYDFFFVPFNQLYRDSENVLLLNSENLQFAASPTSNTRHSEYLPCFKSSYLYRFSKAEASSAYPNRLRIFSDLQSDVYQTDIFGFNLWPLSAKLCNFIGTPYMNTTFIKAIEAGGKGANAPGTFIFVGDVSDPLPSENPDYSKILFKDLPYYGGPSSFDRLISALPFAAYQKIYFDFYRNEHWEPSDPKCYNFDYISSTLSTPLPVFDISSNVKSSPTSNILTLRYANRQDDIFFGVVPSPVGSSFSQVSQPVYSMSFDSSVSSGLIIDKVASEILKSNPIRYSGLIHDSSFNAGTSAPVGFKTFYTDDSSPYFPTPYGLSANSKFSYNPIEGGPSQAGFSIQELRFTTALQRYYEVIGNSSHDLITQMNKQFNATLSPRDARLVEYLGGFTADLSVNQIVNTNLADPESETQIKGTASSFLKSGEIVYTPNCHGYLMCIYHSQVLPDYSLNNFAPHLLRIFPFDFAIPQFSSLGFEPLPIDFLDSRFSGYFGFQSRYVSYKTGVDRILGDLRESMSNWVASYNFLEDSNITSFSLSNGSINVRYDLNYSFFKCNPHDLDHVLMMIADSYVQTDQVITRAQFSVQSVLPLSVSGLPY
ncbi:major capsid protein [Dipodfec virus RodF1_13]|uniref:Major capsid protein n=1 Tax=Dipodfec virus RodF1_13 TaxID=2929291 RepID=A0A976N2K1_9VIRU|nr:major capsid protein [Dipodfec virus RodF1_13]